jgi:hypothetical protein
MNNKSNTSLDVINTDYDNGTNRQVAQECDPLNVFGDEGDSCDCGEITSGKRHLHHPYNDDSEWKTSYLNPNEQSVTLSNLLDYTTHQIKYDGEDHRLVYSVALRPKARNEESYFFSEDHQFAFWSDEPWLLRWGTPIEQTALSPFIDWLSKRACKIERADDKPFVIITPPGYWIDFFRYYLRTPETISSSGLAEHYDSLRISLFCSDCDENFEEYSMEFAGFEKGDVQQGSSTPNKTPLPK